VTAGTLRPGAPATGSLPTVAPATAVVVARGVTPFLATTLRAVAAQTRAPARVLLVDAGERPDPGMAGALREAGLPAGSTTLLTAPGARSFGDAVRAAVAAEAELPGGGAPWLWLLHDDAAPDPTALAELVRAVQAAPSVGVAGVKQRTWTAPARLLEVGVRTSRSGRRMTDVEPGEVDQGQHDGREDVLGVGLVGALVRRDVWQELGGTDPTLGPFGDGLDLSRRARLAGHRVIVVPSAVVRHAQAAYHGLRDPGTDPASIVDLDADGEPDGADPRRSFAARRAALLHQRLVWAPLPLVPLVAVMALLVGLVRVLVRVAAKEPGLAAAELVAPLRALGRPAAVARARAQARRTRSLPRRALRPLQADARTVWRQWRDRRLTRAEARRVVRAPSELELRELAALALRRRAGLAVLAVALVVVTVAAFGPLVLGTLGGEQLVGGALVAASSGLRDVWDATTSGWVPGGLGSPGPADALVTALLPGTALAGGSLGAALAVLVLGSVLLAGLGAWFAAGAATRSVGVRLWAAVVWAALPGLLLAAGQGRVGAVLVHVGLPWLVLGLARAVGAQQVDVVLSGVATAARGQDAAGVPDRDPGAEEWPDPEAWARAGERPTRRRGRRAARREDAAGLPAGPDAAGSTEPDEQAQDVSVADVAAARDEATDVTPVRGTRAVPATGATSVVTARADAAGDALDREAASDLGADEPHPAEPADRAAEPADRAAEPADRTAEPADPAGPAAPAGPVAPGTEGAPGPPVTARGAPIGGTGPAAAPGCPAAAPAAAAPAAAAPATAAPAAAAPATAAVPACGTARPPPTTSAWPPVAASAASAAASTARSCARTSTTTARPTRSCHACARPVRSNAPDATTSHCPSPAAAWPAVRTSPRRNARAGPTEYGVSSRAVRRPSAVLPSVRPVCASQTTIPTASSTTTRAASSHDPVHASRPPATAPTAAASTAYASTRRPGPAGAASPNAGCSTCGRGSRARASARDRPWAPSTTVTVASGCTGVPQAVQNRASGRSGRWQLAHAATATVPSGTALIVWSTSAPLSSPSATSSPPSCSRPHAEVAALGCATPG